MQGSLFSAEKVTQKKRKAWSQALPCQPRSVTLNFVFPHRPEPSEGEAVLNKMNRPALAYRRMFCFYYKKGGGGGGKKERKEKKRKEMKETKQPMQSVNLDYILVYKTKTKRLGYKRFWE